MLLALTSPWLPLPHTVPACHCSHTCHTRKKSRHTAVLVLPTHLCTLLEDTYAYVLVTKQQPCIARHYTPCADVQAPYVAVLSSPALCLPAVALTAAAMPLCCGVVTRLPALEFSPAVVGVWSSHICVAAHGVHAALPCCPASVPCCPECTNVVQPPSPGVAVA